MKHDYTPKAQISLRNQVNNTSDVLKQIRRFVGLDVTATLISAFVLSKLDYCNAILTGLNFKATIAPLQQCNAHKTHAAARLIACLAPHDHVPSILRQLHWLPVHFRINYKLLCLLMHWIHNSRAPSYPTDFVTQTATISSRSPLLHGSSSR